MGDDCPLYLMLSEEASRSCKQNDNHKHPFLPKAVDATFAPDRATWKNENKSKEGAIVPFPTSQQRTQDLQPRPQPAECLYAAMDGAEAGQGLRRGSSVCPGAADDPATPALNPTHGLAEGIKEHHLRIKQNGLLKAINNQKISRGLLMLSLSICCLPTIGSFIHHALGNLK